MELAILTACAIVSLVFVITRRKQPAPPKPRSRLDDIHEYAARQLSELRAHELTEFKLTEYQKGRRAVLQMFYHMTE